MGDNVTLEGRLKKTHGPLRSNAFIYGIPHTRTKEANCVHRVSGASEWNIKISAGSSGVAVSLLNRLEEGRDDVWKKIIIEFKHKYPSMELINISGSESVRLCEKNC